MKKKLSELLQIGVKYIRFENPAHVVFNDDSVLVGEYQDGVMNDDGTWFPGEWTFYYKSADGQRYDIVDDLYQSFSGFSPYLVMSSDFASNIQYGD